MLGSIRGLDKFTYLNGDASKNYSEISSIIDHVQQYFDAYCWV